MKLDEIRDKMVNGSVGGGGAGIEKEESSLQSLKTMLREWRIWCPPLLSLSFHRNGPMALCDLRV